MKKKLLCLVLSAMMVMAVGVVSMSAAGEKDNFNNDSLVTWWNFEGANEVEALEDKAAKGAVKDNLTKLGDEVQIKDGTAYIPQTLKNALYVSEINKSSDLNNVYSMSIYLKAKYEGQNVDFTDLVNANGLFRMYKLKDATSADGAVFEASAFATKNNSALGTVRIRPQSFASLQIKENDWFTLALTMNIDKENKLATAVLYSSKDGEKFEKAELAMAVTDEILADLKVRMETELVPFILGKYTIDPESTVPARGISYTYDEVRVYNKALSDEEVARIIPNSLELREPPKPEETTVPEETTKRVPATETTEKVTEKVTEKAPETTVATTEKAEEKKSGCGSSIGASIVALAAMTCTAAVVTKKKGRR